MTSRGVRNSCETSNTKLLFSSPNSRSRSSVNKRGLSSYLEVVDAQRAALHAERQDSQLRGQRVVTTILLAKALGGGWSRHSPKEGNQ